MYTGIAITTLVIVFAALAKLLKDLLIVRLIRTLARDGALSQTQRFEICARLASSLGPGSQPYNHDSPHASRKPTRQDQVQAVTKRPACSR
jgi:hypothetical protein